VSADPALLLVDDRPENLLALEAVLEPLGHRLVRAQSGEEALRHLLIDEVAVIILDVQMPGLDGFETAAAIKGRERTRDIPILFLTALSREPEHRLLGYASGAVDYIFKPVDPDLLRAKVAVFVELHLAAKRLKEQTELLAWRTAELERSNADLEQFSYIASHDLQEPLRVMTGYLELLADDLGEELRDQHRTWIASATASASRMEALVADLLVYARSGAGEYTPTSVDLDEAVRGALADLGTSLREAGADVDCGELGRALAAAPEVRRILQNLIGNAAKYRGQAAPVIRVSATRAPGWVTVAVSDNGIGVPQADLRRVFGMFERVEGQPYPGTGLGLAICRRLVERAGGHIWMERNQGRGVTVQFTLPAVPS
jgi:two-component system, sensor histidine kinase and response regulator